MVKEIGPKISLKMHSKFHKYHSRSTVRESIQMPTHVSNPLAAVVFNDQLNKNKPTTSFCDS